MHKTQKFIKAVLE